MTRDEIIVSETNPAPKSRVVEKTKDTSIGWFEIFKALVLPLATVFLGFMFNASLGARQAQENNLRFYTEMMGRREQADSDLRKDMFKSILDTFMQKDPKLELDEQLNQEVLNLELLAYNFHESLDLAPLFKHVRGRMHDSAEGPHAELRKRLEVVAREVIERQLTILSDTGMTEIGEALLQKVDSLQAYLIFGAHFVDNPSFRPGEGVSRLCLSMASTDRVKHYRQFKLEVTDYDPRWREIRVRLYASKVLDAAECERADLDLVTNREIDTQFWVGLFDFPMIDNTRLSHGERCAVSLTELSPYSLRVALAYFPGSRASLKDKPYYDEVLHDLALDHHAGTVEH